MDDGLISVFGGIPGETSYGIPGKRVGYMPQVGFTSLLQTFILKQLYFNRIFLILQKWEELQAIKLYNNEISKTIIKHWKIAYIWIISNSCE